VRDASLELAWALKRAAHATDHAARVSAVIDSLADQAAAVVTVCGTHAPRREREAGHRAHAWTGMSASQQSRDTHTDTHPHMQRQKHTHTDIHTHSHTHSVCPCGCA
jgi:hypothetical protein